MAKYQTYDTTNGSRRTGANVSINTVTMSGNLTRDPEIRATQTGMGVVAFNLAVNEWRAGKAGAPGQEVTSYFEWVAFGERWVKLSGYLRKGSVVTMHGKAKQDSYVNKDGKKTYKVSFMLNEIQLPKKQTDTEYYGDKSRKDDGVGTVSIQELVHEVVDDTVHVYDEDIPF